MYDFHENGKLVFVTHRIVRKGSREDLNKSLVRIFPFHTRGIFYIQWSETSYMKPRQMPATYIILPHFATDMAMNFIQRKSRHISKKSRKSYCVRFWITVLGISNTNVKLLYTTFHYKYKIVSVKHEYNFNILNWYQTTNLPKNWQTEKIVCPLI